MAINSVLDTILEALSGTARGIATGGAPLPAEQNLRGITVAGPQPQAPQATPQATPQIPASAPRPQGGGFDLKNFLVRMGIPLAATGVGLASNRALPGAAGFSQGYTQEIAKQDERKREEGATKDFWIVDPEDPDNPRKIKVPKGADIRLKSKEGDFQEDLIRNLLGMEGSKQPESKPAEKKNIQKKVIVEKDGQRFNLPANQLQDAIKQGYKQVDG